jgi:hypothetical protein
MCDSNDRDEGFRVRFHPSSQGKNWHGRRVGAQDQGGRHSDHDVEGFMAYYEGFMAYYVVYAPDDTVTAISIFNDYAGAEESNRRVLTWIEQSLMPLLAGPATAMAGPVIVHTLA